MNSFGWPKTSYFGKYTICPNNLAQRTPQVVYSDTNGPRHANARRSTWKSYRLVYLQEHWGLSLVCIPSIPRKLPGQWMLLVLFEGRGEHSSGKYFIMETIRLWWALFFPLLVILKMLWKLMGRTRPEYSFVIFSSILYQSYFQIYKLRFCFRHSYDNAYTPPFGWRVGEGNGTERRWRRGLKVATLPHKAAIQDIHGGNGNRN